VSRSPSCINVLLGWIRLIHRKNICFRLLTRANKVNQGLLECTYTSKFTLILSKRRDYFDIFISWFGRSIVSSFIFWLEMLFAYRIIKVLFGPLSDWALFMGHGPLSLVSLLIHFNEVFGWEHRIVVWIVNIEIGVLFLLSPNHFRRTIRHPLERFVEKTWSWVRFHDHWIILPH
jgi:hypothetical protein